MPAARPGEHDGLGPAAAAAWQRSWTCGCGLALCWVCCAWYIHTLAAFWHLGGGNTLQVETETVQLTHISLTGQPPGVTPSVHGPAVMSAGVSGSGDAPSQVHLASDLTAFDFKQLQVQDYQAVLINTGWEAPYPQQQQQQQQEPAAGPGPSSTAAAAAGAGSAAAAAAGPGVCSWGLGSDAHAWHVGSSGAGSSVTSRLEQLPIPSLCARGFIMIWANKEHCSGGGCGQTAGWGCRQRVLLTAHSHLLHASGPKTTHEPPLHAPSWGR